jgi:hypothetical protein
VVLDCAKLVSVSMINGLMTCVYYSREKSALVGGGGIRSFGSLDSDYGL